MTEEEKCACVVVLGDLGRSPRMQYHALSLASEGFNVDVIGYGGSEPVSELANHPKVVIRNMPECPNIIKKCPGLCGHVLKVVWQSILLLCYLIFKRRSHNLVVQNAPAIPTVAVCWVYCVLANASFVLDWHNYSYTILALKHGTKHKLVRLCEWYEGYFGRKATSNLCVTRAMKDDLEKKWGVKAVTLYDRPPESMVPLSLPERHTFFLALSKKYPQFKNSSNVNETTFTTTNSENEIVTRPDRPGLLVSSTSWTEDEDFSVLLAALQDYEEACTDKISRLPRLLCAITGKGPMKKFYCDLIKKAGWKHVDVITPWLEPGDYPKLLGSADLGVSLHTSSSGLDLPMKVVDMFGCRLPVVAYNFPCLNELVHHEKNSYKFDNSAELSQRLQEWFHDFPLNAEHLKTEESFRNQLDLFRKLRWHDNWTTTALPLFSK